MDITAGFSVWLNWYFCPLFAAKQAVHSLQASKRLWHLSDSSTVGVGMAVAAAARRRRQYPGRRQMVTADGEAWIPDEQVDVDGLIEVVHYA